MLRGWERLHPARHLQRPNPERRLQYRHDRFLTGRIQEGKSVCQAVLTRLLHADRDKK